VVAWARRALDFDRLDVLVFAALGLICYGVSSLYSWPHAAIAAGAGLLLFALVGVVWRLMPPRRQP
jgi:uncharacterized membrane protein YqjE